MIPQLYPFEYSNADPDRPKNDKATILADTVQMLKDMTAQVNKLKAEYASLTEESREVICFSFVLCFSRDFLAQLMGANQSFMEWVCP